MNRVRFSLRRLRFIAQNTLREAVRQKIFLLLLVLALGLVAGAQFFREFHFGSHELKFLSDLGFGAIAGFGSVLAIVATAQLFFSGRSFSWENLSAWRCSPRCSVAGSRRCWPVCSGCGNPP